MADGYWDVDGNWQDGPDPDKQEEVRPAIPVMQSSEMRDFDRQHAHDHDGEDDGPSLEEIATYVGIGLLALGAIALVGGAVANNNNSNNNNNTSPTDTPTDKESPAPADKGKPIPGEPAPTPKVPVPGPVPQPTPTPAPEPGTGQPPARCWVAREVYGYDNPSWLLFRDYLDFSAPKYFKDFYISHGEKIAEFIKDKPFIKKLIKLWMDTKI